MADTLDEALSIATSATEDHILYIDDEFRTITVPDGLLVGARTDKDVHGLKFEMPRYFHDLDLSTFDIQINYISDRQYTFNVTDKTVEDSVIDFTWLVGSTAFTQAGKVSFAVSLITSDTDGNLVKKFNTTIATMTVVETLDSGDITNSEYRALYQQLRELIGDSATDLSNKVAALQNKAEKYYGMIIHQNIASPNSGKVEYIGINKDYTPFAMNLSTGAWNAGSWGEMPTLTRNRPAMIKTDGTFDYWLDENDYSKKADGQASDVSNTTYDGNAFAWFEPLWIRLKVSGNDLEVRFAYEQLDDDYVEVCPEHCGLWIPMFYMNVVNGKGRSIAGTSVIRNTAGNTTTDAQWASIKANGVNYLFLGGKVQVAISLLKVLWSKSTNSEFWGYGNMKGYNSSDKATYGTKSNPIIGGGQFYGTSDGKSANKFMHSVVLQTQDVFVCDPYLICDNKRFKISTDYHYDISGTTYTDTGIDHGGPGYIKTFTPKDGFLLPTVVGGSTSTYYCDHTWLSADIVAVSLRFASCAHMPDGGGFALACVSDASVSWWSRGAALMLKQLV